MAPFDIFLAVVLGISLIYSIFKGMVREIFSLLSLVAGYVVAIRYQGVGADWLEQFISSATIARLVSFGLLFIFTALAVSIVGWYAKKLIHTSDAFSGLDRLGGAVFGVVKGLLFIILLMFPLQLYPEVYDEVTRDSLAAPHLSDLSRNIISKLDAQGGFVDGLKKKSKEFEKLRIFKDLSDKFKKKGNDAQDDHSSSDRQELNDMLDSIKYEK